MVSQKNNKENQIKIDIFQYFSDIKKKEKNN